MKTKYMLAILLFGILLVGTYVITKDEILEVKETLVVSNLKSNNEIKQIKRDSEKYEIIAYYPVTKYANLNDKILSEINKQIEEFEKVASVPFESEADQKLKLDINFDSYEYNEYISFVFNVFSDTAGAHPNTYSYTISFNTKTKKLVGINELVDLNKDILKILSEYSYNKLKDEDAIKQYGDGGMLKEGIKAEVQNFNRFAFDKAGLKIIFDRYSVAPYVAGAFSVTIPYDKLKIFK